MIKELDLGDKIIKYNLEIKNVKNINLRIKYDQSIYVSANSRVSLDDINQFLLSKKDYIINAIDYYSEIKKYTPQPKNFIDGESFRFLGRNLRLKVIRNNRNRVDSDESYLYLYVKDPSDSLSKNKLVLKWYTTNCKTKVQEICEQVYPTFSKYKIEFPQIRYRNMVSRWGSCQPKRKILTFNYSLVKVPVSLIEYVVIHEFTHFLQPNHSKKFYAQLYTFMPDWKERKKQLNDEVVQGL